MNAYWGGRATPPHPRSREPLADGATLVTLPRGERSITEFAWDAVFQRLGTFDKLADGWDGDRGQPLNQHTIGYAGQVLGGIKRAGGPVPVINPSADGAVYIDWHQHGIDIEMIIEEPYRIIALIDDQQGMIASFEGDDAGLDHVLNALQVMETRRHGAIRGERG